MDEVPVSPLLITSLGFVLGGLFGYVGNRTNFCTMGAVSDIVNMGDWTRMRMWTLAIAVAILGVTALQAFELVDISQSLYGSHRMPWVSLIVGGLCFGVGMTLASGCTSKTLIRIGGGNLKSLVVFLVLAVSADMTLKGLFGVWRVAYLDPFVIQLPSAQNLPALLAHQLGWSAALSTVVLPLVIGVGLIVFSLFTHEARSRDLILGGTVIGALITAAWFVTGYIGFIAEHPDTLEAAWVATDGNRPEALSLVAPYARTLELLIFWSDKSRAVSFGIASAMGMIAGSFLWALRSKTWREETFADATDLKRHIGGAALMGFGGITALGCTVGQGLSGVSTLALGSIIAMLAIIAGSAAMMKFDYWRMMRE